MDPVRHTAGPGWFAWKSEELNQILAFAYTN
jgi:hypothetical protein